MKEIIFFVEVYFCRSISPVLNLSQQIIVYLFELHLDQWNAIIIMLYKQKRGMLYKHKGARIERKKRIWILK